MIYDVDRHVVACLLNVLDMAVLRKQACVFKHPQDEDVCDFGRDPHGVWGYTQHFQSSVSPQIFLMN